MSRNTAQLEWNQVAAPQGFEPRYADPESACRPTINRAGLAELLCLYILRGMVPALLRETTSDRVPLDVPEFACMSRKSPPNGKSGVRRVTCSKGAGRVGLPEMTEHNRLALAYDSLRRTRVYGERYANDESSHCGISSALSGHPLHARSTGPCIEEPCGGSGGLRSSADLPASGLPDCSTPYPLTGGDICHV